MSGTNSQLMLNRGDVMPRGLVTANSSRRSLRRNTLRRLTSGFSLLCGALLISSIAAHADIYHAVSNGETLASVAAKYRVSADTLRTANGLKEANNVPLGAMLLRIPTTQKESSSQAAPILANNTGFGATTLINSDVDDAPNTRGVMTRTMLETVRAGDTWESIAERYRAAGHEVTANDLRRRNTTNELPSAGKTVIVPLGQIVYSSPAPRTTIAANPAPRPAITATAVAQTAPTRSAPITSSAPRSLGGGVYAASEANLPVAKDASKAQAPLFGGGSAVANRGSLSARGGYGQMARAATGNDVRVIRETEEATAPPASNSNPTATSRPVASSGATARVANVVLNGATIRRLPETDAVTLFRCKPGTQLAVLDQKGIWSAVLMSDRSTGWVPTKYLKMTAQSVDISGQLASNPGPGGAARYSVGRYTTESRTVAQALRWLGTPYRYGGTSRRGIDCSALVQTSFRACGITLPRTAATQAKVGQAVDPSNLKPGDRLYFSASGTRIDHTGLYMGDGLFVHASGSGRRVMVSSLFEKRNWNIFVGARR